MSEDEEEEECNEVEAELDLYKWASREAFVDFSSGALAPPHPVGPAPTTPAPRARVAHPNGGALWRRRVSVCLCVCVSVCLCVCVAVWLCGCVAVWLCGCVAVLSFPNPARSVWRRSGRRLLRSFRWRLPGAARAGVHRAPRRQPAPTLWRCGHRSGGRACILRPLAVSEWEFGPTRRQARARRPAAVLLTGVVGSSTVGVPHAAGGSRRAGLRRHLPSTTSGTWPTHPRR
jgi:hypothetical protein